MAVSDAQTKSLKRFPDRSIYIIKGFLVGILRLNIRLMPIRLQRSQYVKLK